MTRKNERLGDKETLSPCPPFSLSLEVSPSPCLPLSLSPCLPLSPADDPLFRMYNHIDQLSQDVVISGIQFPSGLRIQIPALD